MNGSLINIEGLDCSGKTKQVELLKKRIPEIYGKDKLKNIHFPRTQDKNALYANLIQKYLDGDMKQHNPYYIATLYANDRYKFKKRLDKWLKNNDIVICDRYVTSALAFQGSEIEEERRDEFFQWLKKYEYQFNRVPEPDIIIYLDVPISFIEDNLKKREYNDIHEKVDFLRKVKKVYNSIIDKSWVGYRISCFKNGKMLSPTDINDKILLILRDSNII
ncbi:MAG: dTMP kinase [Atribacterota bacterium]